MTESEIHRFIKKKIAEALRELGYNARTEVTIAEGRLDVYATKEGCEPIKVEVKHTHIPEWILLEVNGELPSQQIEPDIILQSKPEVPSYWREESPFHEAERIAESRAWRMQFESEVTASIIKRLERKFGRPLTDFEREYVFSHREAQVAKDLAMIQ